MRHYIQRLFISALICFVAVPVFAQDPVLSRILLIGDAGGNSAVTDALKAKMGLDSNTTVLFLGTEQAAEKTDISNDKILEINSGLLKETGARGIFMPSEISWDNGKPSGYEQIRKESEYIKGLNNPRIQIVPEKGCPGPEKIKLNEYTDLLIMDSQWWLHEYEKPEISSDCPEKNRMQLLNELEDKVSDSRDKLIIFASHHPLKSTGLRSGYFGLKQHIFPFTDLRGLHNAYIPLPVIGSLYPVVRGVFVSRQDMVHARYQDLIGSIDNILNEHPHLLRVAGHEDILQLYREEGNNYIVSGTGTRSGRAQKTPKTPFSASATGFAVIDILASKKVNLTFYEVRGSEVIKRHSEQLMDFSKLPELAPDTARSVIHVVNDSVSSAVNLTYNEAPGIRRLLVGENYRKEWGTPVNLPQFHIGSEKGGFTIEGQGGGKQTTTIRLKDGQGKSWSLRSIVKDPEKVIPENFRHTFAQDLVQDILSASHPYSAAPVSHLSAALDIPAPAIKYFFVPNDTALGYYRTAFAHTVVMLEERDPSKFGEKTDNTWEVFNDRLDKKDVSVEQPQFLKSRMLDIIVADFDRHYEQFKWEAVPGASSKHYLAVPKDRDQAFFLSNGLIMKLFAYSQMPFLKGLRYDIPNAPSFGFVARDIDGLFLNQLNKKDWERTLAGVQANLTDTTIENAVRQMPPEIYSLRGKETADRLKSRRDNIKEAGMDYYDFLAKNVNIPGTNSKEVFKVMQTDTGVAVHVFQEGDSGTWSKIFNRTFRDDETKEIRLYGLNGDDHFRIDPDVSTGIKFRIVGGPGKDSFDLQGPAAKRLYDAASETSTILSRSRTINMISRRPDVNAYSFRESNYSSLRVPTINLGFNIEDGFLAGLGVTATKAGFRQEPFASQHSLSSLFSFIHKAYQVRYSGEMNDVYRHYDVLANAMLVNPALNNFFGFGNESANDTTLPRSFYRVRFSAITGDVAVRKRFFHNKLSFAAGPAFYYYWNTPERNEDRILETPELIGLDSASVYNRKFYAGGRIYAAFNSIDNLLLPTKGIDWQADFSALTALNESSLPLTRLQSSFSLFAPLSSNKRFILVLRLGGGHIFSEHFEYFQALTLGANNFLRGYRKNRFAGSSLAYNSVELRAKLFQVRSKVLPGDLGLVGFNDVGRVWMRGESSAKWHHAYGGGVYYTPFNLVMLSVMMGISEEESLFNISAGAKLNIVF